MWHPLSVILCFFFFFKMSLKIVVISLTDSSPPSSMTLLVGLSVPDALFFFISFRVFSWLLMPSMIDGTSDVFWLVFSYEVLFCWLLNVPATRECISGTDLLRQFYVLPHWDKSCRSNFPSHQSQYTDTRPTRPSTDPIMPGTWQGSHWSANF